MTLDEVKDNIGKMVMTVDPGSKLIRRLQKPHGPYRILKLTKGGLVILEGYEKFRVSPSNLISSL